MFDESDVSVWYVPYLIHSLSLSLSLHVHTHIYIYIGTSSSRFVMSRDGSKAQEPSVGTYDIHERWDVGKGATSAFESQTKRHALDEQANKIKTEPAKYYIKQKWIRDEADERKNTLLKGSKRFQVSKHAAKIPGPASYDVASPTSRTIPQDDSTTNHHVMISTEKRFLKPKSTVDDTPGVGTYNPEMVYGNLNTPTFNISIAKEMYM